MLARVFAYLPSFLFQILDFIYCTVLIFIFRSILNGVTLKTINTILLRTQELVGRRERRTFSRLDISITTINCCEDPMIYTCKF